MRLIIIFSIFLILPIGIFTNLLEQPYIFSLGFDYIQLGFIFAISRGVMGALTIYSEKYENKFGQKASFLIVNLAHLIIFVIIVLIQIKIIIIFLFIAFFKINARLGFSISYGGHILLIPDLPTTIFLLVHPHLFQ